MFTLYYHPHPAFYLGYGLVQGTLVVEGGTSAEDEHHGFEQDFLTTGVMWDVESATEIYTFEDDDELSYGKHRRGLMLSAGISIPTRLVLDTGPIEWQAHLGIGVRLQ